MNACSVSRMAASDGQGRDAKIGENLTGLRGSTSQQDLANEMRRRGFKWSQATVWSVEKGERPLRLAEADALADFFGVPLDALARTGRGERESTAVIQAAQSAHDAVIEQATLQRQMVQDVVTDLSRTLASVRRTIRELDARSQEYHVLTLSVRLCLQHVREGMSTAARVMRPTEDIEEVLGQYADLADEASRRRHAEEDEADEPFLGSDEPPRTTGATSRSVTKRSAASGRFVKGNRAGKTPGKKVSRGEHQEAP